MSSHNQWAPTREAALAELRAFSSQAGAEYTRNRNFDRGSPQTDGVSRLSPWIRHRCLSESEVIQQILEQHTAAEAEKFIQEVYWRSYWKGWMEMRPLVWHQYCRSLEELYCSGDLVARCDQATAANTGIECFDYWCRELVTTGYLHNHARMWFSSIWIFTLRLPWELGADFFMRHLLDGDVASNTLSWRWVGGLHTKGKIYLAQADNIAKYTDGRFNPHGQLTQSAEPLTESFEFSRQELPLISSNAVSGRLGLLITDDDLHPSALFDSANIVAVALCSERCKLSPAGVSPRVTKFTGALMADASARYSDLGVHQPQQTNDTVQTFVDWAVKNKLSSVVSAYVPVGPNASLCAALSSSLQDQGITYHAIRRRWDDVVWPHAGKGFFALKKHIPELLEQFALSS